MGQQVTEHRFNPKDAPRVLARVLQDGRLDRRTAPVRAMEAIVGALAGDWGGLDSMPAAARLLVDRTAVLGVRLALLERAVLAGEPTDAEADKTLVSLNTAFRKNLETLTTWRRVAVAEDDTPELHEYIARKLVDRQ